MKKLHLLSTIAVALVLTGCGQALKSDYQRPMLSIPDTWRVEDTGEGVAQFSPLVG